MSNITKFDRDPYVNCECGGAFPPPPIFDRCPFCKRPAGQPPAEELADIDVDIDDIPF